MSQEVTSPSKIKFEDKPTLPLITGLLVIATVGVYCFHLKVIDSWFQSNVWNTETVITLVQSGNWAQLLMTFVWANFAEASFWQTIGNVYFLWVFGTAVEQKVGASRYMTLVLVGLILPWVVLSFDAYHRAGNFTYCFSPIYLLCTLVGAYKIFPSEESARKKSWMPRPRNEIFRREPRPGVADGFRINPLNYIAFFLAFEIGIRFWVLHDHPNFDSARLVPSIVAFGLGYFIALAYAKSATHGVGEGSLKMLVLKCYRELAALDVPHEDAIKGTARSLGLPDDKVREWVAQKKGKLRTK